MREAEPPIAPIVEIGPPADTAVATWHVSAALVAAALCTIALLIALVYASC